MQIYIKVTSEEYGTELGELCPPTYTYECSVYESAAPGKRINDADEDHQIVTINDMQSKLEPVFLDALNKYLNSHFRDFLPTNYELIMQKVQLQTIAASPSFAAGAVMGLFAGNLPKDVTPPITSRLDKKDILNASSTSTQSRKMAINGM